MANGLWKAFILPQDDDDGMNVNIIAEDIREALTKLVEKDYKLEDITSITLMAREGVED